MLDRDRLSHNIPSFHFMNDSNSISGKRLKQRIPQYLLYVAFSREDVDVARVLCGLYNLRVVQAGREIQPHFVLRSRVRHPVVAQHHHVRLRRREGYGLFYIYVFICCIITSAKKGRGKGGEGRNGGERKGKRRKNSVGGED